MRSVSWPVRRFLASLVALVLLASWALPQPAAAQSGALVSAALDVLEQEYADPVQPVALLNAALGQVRHEAGVTATALPDIPGGAGELQARAMFLREFANASRHGTLSETQLSEDAATAMLASLHDSHTTYLPPQAIDEMEAEIHNLAVFSGIGVAIGAVAGANGASLIVITDVYPGTPAAIAGLHPFDVIESVNSHGLQGATPEDVSTLIRGPAGSRVTLGIRRAGHPFRVAVSRAPIHLTAAWGRIIAPGIGYVRLAAFPIGAAQTFAAAVHSLGPVGALVLDLRGNPGGLIDEVQQIASLFLPPGTPIARAREHGAPVRTLVTAGPAPFADLPLAVLTDGGSASAAEILTGALEDAGRAMTVGARTAGALGGSVTFRLPVGGMSVTEERILGPRGEIVEGHGIEPTLTVALSVADIEAGRDPQLLAALAAVTPQQPATIGTGYVPVPLLSGALLAPVVY